MIPTVNHKSRIAFLLILIFIGFGILIVRLAIVQLVQGAELQNKAIEQWTRELDVSPMRGQIVDTNGVVFAQSATSYNVAATPKMIDQNNVQQIAQQIASVIEVDIDKLTEDLQKTTTGQVWVKRQITKEQMNALKDLGISGLNFTEEPQRFYPQSTLASNVIGFTMKYPDGKKGLEGQEGLELYYNKYLSGYAGKVVRQTDAGGRELPSKAEEYIPPVDGLNLKVTLDAGLQHFVEKAAAHAMQEYQAKKVYCVMMEPKTGRILAMANQPTFDANNPPRELGYENMQNYIKNFTCKDSVEPGSIFKIVTLSAAIEEGVVNENSTFYCPGYKIVDGDRIKCWKAGGHGHQTLAEAVQNSCNVAFMEMGLGLGKDKYYDYLEAFGFGEKTGVDVLGESAGILIPESYVKTVDLARIAFGQSVSMTPLQVVNAISAAVNGGNLMQPYIGEEIYQSNVDFTTGAVTNETVEIFEPHVVKRAISESTSELVRKIMVSVVDEGSGYNSQVAGYSVGGKTGTAQKYGEDGKIAQGKYIASFVAFAPQDDPRIAIVFMVDEPIAPVVYGSTIAAPYVGEVLTDALAYLDIKEDREKEEQVAMTTVPDIIGMPLEEAKTTLEENNFKYNIYRGEGNVVETQIPMPGADVPEGITVLLYVTKEQKLNRTVPNVEGKTVREANAILSKQDLQLVIEGKGLAQTQTPAAGEMVDKDTKVTVVFVE